MKKSELQQIIREEVMDVLNAKNAKNKKQRLSENTALFDRMEGVNRFKTMDSLRRNIKELVEVWEEEGFEKDDIMKYLEFLVNGGW